MFDRVILDNNDDDNDDDDNNDDDNNNDNYDTNNAETIWLQNIHYSTDVNVDDIARRTATSRSEAIGCDAKWRSKAFNR